MDFKTYIDSLPRSQSPRAEMIKKIAKACGVDQSVVYNWKAGRHGIKPVYRKIIAEVIGRPKSELFPES